MANLIRQFIKGRTSAGLRAALRQVQSEYRLLQTHRRGLKKTAVLRGQKNLKLNIACGPNPKNGWVNIDLYCPGTEVIPLDLREPLPFDDGSAEIVYSEHFFEHLAYPVEVGNFLQESRRVLKPGGLFRAGMPDASILVTAYGLKNESLFQRATQWHPPSCDTWMHQLNYVFRQGTEHKYAWDFETLAKVLTTAGFVGVMRSEFDPAFDSPSRQVGTMYVNARNSG